MKCIYCSGDTKYKDRKYGRKCSSCGKGFAFEPQEGDPITDVLFKKAIDAVSASGRIRWGVEHLPYELARRKSKTARRRRIVAAIFVALLGFFALLAGASGAIGATVFIGFFALVSLLVLMSSFSAFDLQKFDDLWKRWVKVHGLPAGVIVRKPKASARSVKEADVGDYSFDRAVICDRARTVDLLLANNFHFEHSCAVLALGGYPQAAFDTVRAMLKRNPRLQVYALHDATVSGCRLAQLVSTDPDWFGGRIRAIDLGLRPKHAARHRAYWKRELVQVSPNTQGLDAHELDWLRTYTMELAVLRPEQILKTVGRALGSRATLDDTGTWSDSGSSSSGTDSDVDSFG